MELRGKKIAILGERDGVPAHTIEQAIERAGTKAGNKGWDAAMSAIEMASLMKALR